VSSFWSDLEVRVGRDGIDAVLADPDAALDADVRRALEFEVHHLRGWDPTAQPTLLAQQMLTRTNALGMKARAAEIREHVNAERQLVLCEVWRTRAFSPAITRTLAGHSDGIADAAFAPDDQLYTVAFDGEIRKWDIDTGRSTTITLTTLIASDGSTPRPRRLALSPHGDLLAVAFTDDVIRVATTADGTASAVLPGHTSGVHRLRFFPDGRRLASSGEDGTVRLWDVVTGTPLHVLEGHQRWVTGLAVSRDGATLVSGSYDRTLRVWDTATGRCRQVVDNGEAGWVVGVTFSRHDTALATCSENGAVHLYRADDGYLREPIELDGKRPERGGPGIAWSVTPLGDRHVLVTYDDAVVDVLSTERHHPEPREMSLLGHGLVVRACAVTADGRMAVTGDDRGTLLLWNLDTPVPDAPLGMFFQVETIAVSAADGLLVTSPNQELRLRALDLRTGAQQWEVLDKSGIGPRDMWFGRDGSSLFTYDGQELQNRWTATGEVRYPIPDFRAVIGARAAAAVTATEEYGTGTRYRVRLVNVGSGAVVRSLGLPPSHPYPGEADVTPDFAAIVLGADGTLTRWRTGDGETTTAHLEGEPARDGRRERKAFLFDVAIDDEGCHAIGVDATGRAHIWDIDGGGVVIVTADSVQAPAVAGLAEHRAVTVGGKDGHAIVWDLTTARPACVAPLDSTLTAVDVDGPHIVVGDAEGNAHVLVLLQGDPTPPPPPPAPPAAPPAPPQRRSWWQRLLGS
jgi:WD40 repeat protein